mgnify:CR=1 FL=1
MPMAFEKRRALSPVAPVYLNVTPQWLLEARRRPAEELLQLKWHGLLSTRAFGFAKEEFVCCLKDDDCLGALIRGICAAVKDGSVRAKKTVLKRWLVFCFDYWELPFNPSSPLLSLLGAWRAPRLARRELPLMDGADGLLPPLALFTFSLPSIVHRFTNWLIFGCVTP